MDTSKNKSKYLTYFFALAIFQSIVANFAHPATPTIITNLGLNDYMFGVAFAGMSITNFLFSPFWGKISDQVGRRKILMIASIGYSVGQGVFGLATTELGILVGRMIAGFFIGGWTVSQLSYIMDYSEPSKKGKNFTLLATIQSVASALGFLIGGYISEFSIPMMFTVQVIGLSTVGILSGLLCKDEKSKDFQKSVSLKVALQGSNPFGAFFRVGKQMTPVLITLLVVALLGSFSAVAYDQCFNFFIKDQLSFSPSNNGVLRAGLGLVALIVNMTVGMWIMKKTNLFKSLYTVVFTYSLVLCGLLFPTALPIFVAINVVLYSLNALFNPLMQSTFAQGITDQSQSGAFMGVFSSIKALGMVIGSLFAGFIYSTGPRLSFLYAAVGFAVAGVLALYAFNLRNKEIKK